MVASVTKARRMEEVAATAEVEVEVEDEEIVEVGVA